MKWYKDPIIIITLIVAVSLMVVILMNGGIHCKEDEDLVVLMAGKVPVATCI